MAGPVEVAVVVSPCHPNLWYVPATRLRLCVPGAVVFTIAIRLIDLRGLRAIRRESPEEYFLALATAAIVAIVGVEQGILLATVLSLLRIVQYSYHPHSRHEEAVQDDARCGSGRPAVPIYLRKARTYLINPVWHRESF